MTRKPKHPAISEDDLLDLVEGRLPLERIQELEPHLRADPDLAARVKAMSHDRAHLRASASMTYAAPPGLIDGAIAQAEREALMDDRPAARATAATMPKLIGALAAGVALTLTVALAANFMLSRADSHSNDRLATAQPSDELPLPAPTVADEKAEAIAAPALGAQQIQRAAAPNETAPAVEPSPEQHTITALTAPDFDRAERLARDNRLRVVITMADESVPIASLSGLQSIRARDGRLVIRPLDLAMFGLADAPTITPTDTDHAIFTHELAAGTYTAETELAGAAGIRALLRTLEKAGHEVRIEQAPRAQRPRTRAGDVLWWTPSSVDVPAERALIALEVRKKSQ